MVSNTSNTKASEMARATQLVGGMKLHFANTSTLKFASADHTPAEIETALQALIDLHQAVETAKSAEKAKLALVKSNAPALRKLMAALVKFVKATFSESPDVLADFGLAPEKVAAPLTTEQQAVALAKRKSTRAARGTTGSKAKKAVKGDVVGIVVTPVTAVPVASPVAPSPTGNGGAKGGASNGA
jgi:hypothetical protein